MKRRHVHSWRVVGHPFGSLVRYECSSCPVTRTENRLSQAQRISQMEDALGIPAHERLSKETDDAR